MMQILQKTAELYNQASPSEDKIKVWFELFRYYDYKTLDMALNRYAEKGKYQPKPADLIEIYRDIIHKREAEAKAQTMESAKDCKYCEGTGWFRTITSSGESYVCACKCQGNPTNLNLALASRDFKWSDEKRAFVPRDTWVGDIETGSGQGEFCFDDVGNLAKVL